MTHVSTMVCRAAAGDESAWEELVGQYNGLLLSIAKAFRLTSEEAADAAQTTWLRLVQHIDRLREPEKVCGWLSSTMRHECTRVVRQRRREQLIDDWTGWSIGDDGDSIDADLLLAERNALLWQVVDRLPARQRQLLHALSTSATPSYNQVSVQLSMAVGTIGPTRARAVRRLRKLLTEAGATEGGLDLAS